MCHKLYQVFSSNFHNLTEYFYYHITDQKSVGSYKKIDLSKASLPVRSKHKDLFPVLWIAMPTVFFFFIITTSCFTNSKILCLQNILPLQ